MSEYRNAATCDIGFWKPAHAGCPVCGPDGPCTDPAYEALIQETETRDRFRRVLWRTVLAVCAVIAVMAYQGVQ